jgi:hypothetical protein
VLHERGIRHEEDYVRHFRARGLEIEIIPGIGLDAGAVAAMAEATRCAATDACAVSPSRAEPEVPRAA